jgi:L-asparaginase II
VPHQLVAEVVRSGLVESVHYGSVVVLRPDGSVGFTLGDVDVPMYPRSSNKPVQAAAMVRLGLPFDGELLALAAASHSGEDFHLKGTQQILAAADLDESALQNTPGWPLDSLAMLAYIRRGNEQSALADNCSGKHAAMLVTCTLNGWPTENYRDPEHPLQRAIAATLAELAGEPVAHTGVDGCGAPLFALTLIGLTRAFRALALAEPGSPERRVVDAFQAHPEWASGTTRDEAKLIRGVPGLFGKAGAEGVYAAAVDDGSAVAMKIADGHVRARPVVMAAALRKLGLDYPVLEELGNPPVYGHGDPVGEIRAVV